MGEGVLFLDGHPEESVLFAFFAPAVFQFLIIHSIERPLRKAFDAIILTPLIRLAIHPGWEELQDDSAPLKSILILEESSGRKKAWPGWDGKRLAHGVGEGVSQVRGCRKPER